MVLRDPLPTRMAGPAEIAQLVLSDLNAIVIENARPRRSHGCKDCGMLVEHQRLRAPWRLCLLRTCWRSTTGVATAAENAVCLMWRLRISRQVDCRYLSVKRLDAEQNGPTDWRWRDAEYLQARQWSSGTVKVITHFESHLRRYREVALPLPGLRCTDQALKLPLRHD